MTEKYTKAYAQVKKWRERTDDKIYYVMGDKCVICGYNTCRQALDFHHIDPSKKDFTFGRLRVKTLAWHIIEAELRKCVVLCANCHREYHAGLIGVELVSSFSEERMLELKNSCKQCSKDIQNILNDFCSRSCRSKYNAAHIDIAKKMRESKSVWANVDVVDLVTRHNGVMVKAAKEVGLSDNGVKHQFQKVTGYKNWKSYQNGSVS